MKTVILAGGRGTRLLGGDPRDPQADGRHRRPADPVAHHVRTTRRYGFTDFVVALGYKGYVIKEYFANQLLHECDVSVDLKSGTVQYLSTQRPGLDA